jgi:hypothetical protein
MGIVSGLNVNKSVRFDTKLGDPTKEGWKASGNDFSGTQPVNWSGLPIGILMTLAVSLSPTKNRGHERRRTNSSSWRRSRC